MPMVSQCSPICVDTTRVSLESPDAVRSNYSAAVLNCVKFAPIFDPKSCHLSLQYKLPVRRVWSDCRLSTWLWGQVRPGCQQGLPADLLYGREQLQPIQHRKYHWLSRHPHLSKLDLHRHRMFGKVEDFCFLCSNVFQMSHSCICCNSLACEFMKIYAFVWFPIRPIYVLPFVIAFYYVHIGSWQMFGSPSPVPKLSLRLLLLCGACFYLCLMGISGFLALHVSVLNWGDSKSSIPRKGLNMGLQKKLTIPDHEIRSLLSIKNWNLDGWGYFF